MKYKVGDKVRLENGVVCTISSYYAELGCQFPDAFKCKGEVNGNDIAPVRLKSISHLVISEITDEFIDRFKNEKIAWHFKKKEDYEKTLDILYSKGVVYKSPRWLFNYNCIHYNFEQEWLERQNIGYYKKEEFEIIEIMNPVYVPINLKIDDEWINIDVIRFVENNLWAQYKDYKKQYYYKNQNVEEMFQQYMQQNKIPDLENKVENQKEEIKNLHEKVDRINKRLFNHKEIIEKMQQELFVVRRERNGYIKKLQDIHGILDEN